MGLSSGGEKFESVSLLREYASGGQELETCWGGLRDGGGLIDPAVRVLSVSGIDLCALAPLREKRLGKF